MPAGKKGKKSKTKPDDGRTEGPNGSATWEEHSERVLKALSIGTGHFLRANAERIGSATSQVAAKNSYMSGMIDVLTVARNALGFCGADQILLELERLNVKRAPMEGASGPPGEMPPRKGVPGTREGDIGNVPPKGHRRKAVNATHRDPMFA